MPVAIDTSVLIAAEKIGGLEPFIAAHDGLFYIPAHVAAEFLVGTHLPSKRICANARGGFTKMNFAVSLIRLARRTPRNWPP